MKVDNMKSTNKSSSKGSRASQTKVPKASAGFGKLSKSRPITKVAGSDVIASKRMKASTIPKMGRKEIRQFHQLRGDSFTSI